MLRRVKGLMDKDSQGQQASQLGSPDLSMQMDSVDRGSQTAEFGTGKDLIGSNQSLILSDKD